MKFTIIANSTRLLLFILIKIK